MATPEIEIFSKKESFCFLVRVQPRARRNQIVGTFDGALKVQLTAPPLEGRANRLLLQYLASELDLPKKSLRLVSGSRSRQKTIAVSGFTADGLRRHLIQYLV